MPVCSLTAASESRQERQEEEAKEGEKREERRQRKEKRQEAQKAKFKFKLRWWRLQKTQVPYIRKLLDNIILCYACGTWHVLDMFSIYISHYLSVEIIINCNFRSHSQNDSSADARSRSRHLSGYGLQVSKEQKVTCDLYDPFLTRPDDSMCPS